MRRELVDPAIRRRYAAYMSQARKQEREARANLRLQRHVIAALQKRPGTASTAPGTSPGGKS